MHPNHFAGDATLRVFIYTLQTKIKRFEELYVYMEDESSAELLVLAEHHAPIKVFTGH